MKTTIGLVLAPLLMVGCADVCQSYLLVQMPAVSMSMRASQGQRATAIGPVNAKFCYGEPPLVSQDGTVGLIDEAIAKAEKQTGASYIADARFTQSCGCMILEGTAMRLEGAGPPPAAQGPRSYAVPPMADRAGLAKTIALHDRGACTRR
ncbi:MAG TPA: hypothetical protein VH853_16410 [Polyangia bacterium]|jgi:hypothetical protein|nr:hypothetical protein [Polyangia bacterium]